MKILIVTSSPIYHKEGPSTYGFELAGFLKKLGFDVEFLAFNTSGINDVRYISGVKIYDYFIPHPTRWSFYFKLLLKLSLKIVSLMRERDFDLVHGIGGYSLPISIARTFYGLNTRFIITAVGSAYEEHLYKFLSYTSTRKRLSSLASLISTKLIGEMLYNKADLIICDSKYVADRIKSDYNVSKHKICIVPYSINIDRFRANKNYIHRPENVLYVGRLIDRKGIMDLVKSYKNIIAKFSSSNFKLKLIGRGYLKSRILEYLKVHGINRNVEIYDRIIPDKEWPRVYKSGQIFVMPSRYEPSISTTLLEAMASCLCPVASDAGGHPEVIESYKNGILYKKGDVCELSNVLFSLVNDDKLRRRLALNAYKKVAEHFSWQANIKKYLKIYYSLI